MSPRLPQDDEPAGRIAVLTPELADQIAAGEVVERPASVVKELVENAIDAGARRVEVELEEAGLARIVVRDDGAGIHPDDLALATTRHATSKLGRGAELLDVATLGFRGEALASIAAVAQVVLDSRQRDASAGTRMRSRPGLPPEFEPVGMPVGTRIEVLRLFANVPARRKFMRAEATEVGHCSETMLRLGLSHPGVHLRLRHGKRQLLDLPPGSMQARIEQVLRRRSSGPIRHFAGARDGVSVDTYLAPPAEATRTRGGLYIIVRRRVVTERSLSQIVSAALGDAVPGGRHPVGALLVEPPPREVDVNVHPQKSEVRFSDPQRVYGAARHVVADAVADLLGPPQALAGLGHPEPAGGSAAGNDADASGGVGPSDDPRTIVRRFGPDPATAARRALDGWQSSGGTAPAGDTAPYRLRTRAAADGYATYRGQVRDQVADLRQRTVPRAAPTEPAPAPPIAEEPDFTLLTCLPGPLALVRHRDDLLAVDLRALRSHLVYRRMVRDIGGGDVVAQGLLSPAVVKRPPADVALCQQRADALAALGLVVEAFGADALLVRAVPAHLRDCVDEPDVAELIGKVLPWLRVRDDDRNAALAAMATTGGADPAPRLARRWLRELLAQGEALEEIPGIRRFTATDLGLGS